MAPLAPRLALDDLVAMYRIAGGPDEAATAVHVIGDIGDRLRRLGDAYGEWQRFEPEPYFDLYPVHAAELLHMAERVTTVHAIFYVDALLPSFQAALQWLLTDYIPARRTGDAVYATTTMVERWQRLMQVLTQVRAALAADAMFLSLNATTEERNRWRAFWRLASPVGTPPALAPGLAAIPSLTLAVTFPLPANRQPGRLRRLRRARASSQKSRRRAPQTPGQP